MAHQFANSRRVDQFLLLKGGELLTHSHRRDPSRSAIRAAVWVPFGQAAVQEMRLAHER